jgi:hypothetical protein
MWAADGTAAREEIAPKESRFKVIAKSLRGRGHTEAFAGHSCADLDRNCRAPLSTGAFFRWRLE